MFLTFKFKKNLFIALIVSAIILLTTNIVMKNYFSGDAEKESNLKQNKIITNFGNILQSFGIESNLIKVNDSIDKKSGRTKSFFKVQVPKDLTIPEILQELYKTFRKDSLIIKSVEKVKGGKTIFTLKNGASIILEAEFDYSKNYSRNMGSFVFIIYNANPENPSTILLLESARKLNFLIRPETRYVRSLELFANNAQQFSVLIDDEISEQKYKLAPGFSEKRIINVVKTLVTDFRNAVCFVVDDNSDFYKSSNFEVLNRELLKRNIKLFKISDFVLIDDSENLSIDFSEKVNLLRKGESAVFLLNEETYLKLMDDILKFQKMGYRVITSSLVL